MQISFRNLNNNENEYLKLYKWCQNKFVYEWFEQRILSLDEIRKKYRSKLLQGKQDLFIIQYNKTDIGLVQIYKYQHDENIKELDNFKNIYEYDLFIGVEKYLNKGIGSEIVKAINKMIYKKYNAETIILRPFKRNIRAIKCYQKCNFTLITEYEDQDTLGNPEVISLLLNIKKH